VVEQFSSAERTQVSNAVASHVRVPRVTEVTTDVIYAICGKAGGSKASASSLPRSTGRLPDAGSMVIRDYHPSDAQPLMELFHATVHTVCAADCSPEQLAAWSPESRLQVDDWKARFAVTKPFVAENETGPVGFIELDADGHIDCLYVHREFQRSGIGSRLLHHAIAEAVSRSLPRIDAEVSITAVAFFKSHEFRIVRSQEVERNGQRFKNFVMQRLLTLDSSRFTGPCHDE
jgi:ribosomal protein S18 acetylase RimI-like enzyme